MRQPQLFCVRNLRCKEQETIHQIGPTPSRGLAHGSQSTVFAVQWWAVVPHKEIYFQVLSKTPRSQQHLSTIWQFRWAHNRACVQSFGFIFFLLPVFGWNEYQISRLHQRVCTQHKMMFTPLQDDTADVPKEMFPVPVLSNSWKATMNRASGAHRTDSKAKNSWKEISLFGGERQHDRNQRIIPAFI